MISRNRNITVFGAYGHTGRFVVAELVKHGLTPVLSGRDAKKLKEIAELYPGLETRTASIDDPASLEKAIANAEAVINCAGPFLDTAKPLIEAAIRSGIHYLDVTAEQTAALTAFEQHAEAATNANVIVIPAMAFYGGLGDLLATAAVGDWSGADEIQIAIALDSWHPTVGTRLTGERNTYRRMVFSKNDLEFLADPPPKRTWVFSEPFGIQDVIGLPLSEIITISRHIRTPEIHTYLNLAPLNDLHDVDTPPPVLDESGRSPQIFLMEVVARKGNEGRRATGSGRDIYAVTAPIVVEATKRILKGLVKKTAGVVAAGEVFDAEDFLNALSPNVQIHINRAQTVTATN